MSAPKSESDLKFLRNSRKFMRSEITRLFNKVNTDLDSLTADDRRYTLTRLQALHTDIKELDSRIAEVVFSADVSEEEMQTEYDACAEYARKIIVCVSILDTVLLSEREPSPRLDTGEDLYRSQLKLPQIPLPEYGHEPGEDLHKFLSNFEAILSKYRISGYEKFCFLQRQLRNAPLTLIKSLELSKQNYASAKELLIKAFASPTTQKFETLDRLSKMKFALGDDPYHYISQMRSIVESFETLAIETNPVYSATLEILPEGTENEHPKQFSIKNN